MDRDEALIFINSNVQVIESLGPVSSTDVNQVVQVVKQTFTGPVNLHSYPFPYQVIRTTGKKDYFFVMAPTGAGDDSIGVLIYGAPIDPGNQLGRLIVTLVLASLSMIAVAIAGGLWLADRAMTPVHLISQTAQNIGETDLSKRININQPDELGELAETFDQMLARLEAAFERQRQFTADASHELRTPLTIVGLEAERALAAPRTPAEYQSALGIIRSENEIMSQMVNDMLTLTRMDSGKTNFKLETVDLSDVALEVVERLTPLAASKGVKLKTGELPELNVHGDRQYLSQMISNLVENAIKYSGDTGPYVRVETGARLEERSAYIKIEDNGPGISPEHLPHLFERFYRADPARSRDTRTSAGRDGQEIGGSGLGLAIVQRIAQSHRGHASVQSEVGKGSTFEVRIPLI
jgi:heavy metal sensor kinase